MVIKGKVLLYSLPSVGPGADPGVQAVNPQMTLSHPPGGRLQLVSTQACVYLHSFHQMAPTVHGSTHQIPAHYLFIDPERMKD